MREAGAIPVSGGEGKQGSSHGIVFTMLALQKEHRCIGEERHLPWLQGSCPGKGGRRCLRIMALQLCRVLLCRAADCRLNQVQKVVHLVRAGNGCDRCRCMQCIRRRGVRYGMACDSGGAQVREAKEMLLSNATRQDIHKALYSVPLATLTPHAPRRMPGTGGVTARLSSAHAGSGRPGKDVGRAARREGTRCDWAMLMLLVSVARGPLATRAGTRPRETRLLTPCPHPPSDVHHGRHAAASLALEARRPSTAMRCHPPSLPPLRCWFRV